MGQVLGLLSSHGWTDLCKLVEGELFAGLHQLLDHLSDAVSRQRQVGRLKELMELVLADEPIVVHVCGSRKRFTVLCMKPMYTV